MYNGCLSGLGEWLGYIVGLLRPTMYYEIDTLLLGFKNAGKTSFVEALSKGHIETDTVPTMRMKVSKVLLDKKVNESQMRIVDGDSDGESVVSGVAPSENTALVGGSPEPAGSSSGPARLVMKVYDPSGQAKNRHLWEEYLATHASNLNCIVYMVDVSDSLTLDEATGQLRKTLILDNETQQLPFLVIFNKCDLVDDLEATLKAGPNYNVPSEPGTPVKKRQVPVRRKRSSRYHSEVHNRRAKLLLNGSSYHNLLLEYLGISSPDGERIYIERQSGAKQELCLDLGLFLLSLKEMNGAEPDGARGAVSPDKFDAVVDWIVGDV